MAKNILSMALLLFACQSFAQKLDILLIGVSHNYSSYRNQDFSEIYKKIEAFGPDAFFGEFLSREDEQNLMDYWCKESNTERLSRLRRTRPIAKDTLDATIERLKKQTAAHRSDYRLKADLAHAYYVNQDAANGHYQYWKVYSYLQKKPDDGLQKYLDDLLQPEQDATGRSMKRLQTSEYARIAFPMMEKLEMNELHPMDAQDYDLNWSASALAFHSKFEMYAKDSAAAYSGRLKGLLTERTKGFEKYKSIELASPKVTEWLNTDEASSILASGDFYFPEMYGLPDFPKEEMLSKLHWWLMRNMGMCENAVNRARRLGARKIVVITGANHRKYMQDLFAGMPQVTVRNINELTSK